MKRYWVMLAAVVGLLLTVGGCGVKRVPPKQAEAFLAYMSEKYNDEFEIEEIEYERQHTHDPVIPFPSFGEPYSDDIRAILKKKDADRTDGEDQNIRVYYQHETDTFTDSYQEELIKENLLFFVLDKELKNIEHLEYDYTCYSYDDVAILYPQGMEGYYDVEHNSEEYAYQYLSAHKVSIVLSPERLNIVCPRGEEDEILKELDVIFTELFSGDDNRVSVWFYDPKDREADGEDANPFLLVDYKAGGREDFYAG